MKLKDGNLYRIFLAACFLILALAPVFGQNYKQTTGIIFVFLEDPAINNAEIYSIFDNIPNQDIDECLLKIHPSNISKAAIISQLSENNILLNKENSSIGIRWTKGAPGVFFVYVLHQSGKKIAINFKEKERETLLESDLKDVLPLISRLLTVEAVVKGPQPTYVISFNSYPLKYRRANLTVDIKLNSEAEPPGAENKEASTLSLQVITGNKEHWFLSADVFAHKLSDIKYSEKDKQKELEPTDIPKDVYISLNWMIGDLILSRQAQHPKKILRKIFNHNNLYAKFMMKLSKRPLDSVGIGVGYRMPNIDILNNFSIFAAWVWAKDENATTKSIWKNQIQFGLSYNLKKANSWIK